MVKRWRNNDSVYVGDNFTKEGNPFSRSDLAVPLELARNQINYIGTDYDDLLTSYILSAQQQVEAATGRSLVTRKFIGNIPYFPRLNGSIYLSRTPLVMDGTHPVTIEYVPEGEKSFVEITDTDSYLVAESSPPFIEIYESDEWPQEEPTLTYPVRVSWYSGYAQTEIPQPLIQAMLLQIGSWFETRESVTRGSPPFIIRGDTAWDSLIQPFRVLVL